jgi:dTDP-4-dehydrorhamnose 3,5-epimerase-like enzyme
MDVAKFEIAEIPDSGDMRGGSFPVPSSWFESPFSVRDLHVSTIRPGCIRGNHYHVLRSEILVVSPGPRWSLFFDGGPDTVATQREFCGSRAVVVAVPPMMSHAIRNDGDVVLHLIGITDGPYDPEEPDAFARRVVPS